MKKADTLLMEDKIRQNHDLFRSVVEKYARPEGQSVILEMIRLICEQERGLGMMIGIDRLSSESTKMIDLANSLFPIKGEKS